MRRNAQKWIPFGFDTDSNKIVDIASVENGLSCNCICLICGTSLIARQGQNKKWHFSHSTEVKGVCSELTLQHIKKYIKVKIQEKKGTVAKLAMRQPFVLFKGLTFQKLCLPGAFRPGDHHN
ncbi:hypothetical protein ACFMIT_29095, partial [Klebsiella pneumoniae]